MAVTLQENTTQQLTRFQTLFSNMELVLNGKTARPIHEWRRKAMLALEEVPFPTRRDEDWKYTSSGPILAPDYSLPSDTDLGLSTPLPFIDNGIKIVLKNGFVDTAASDLDKLPEGVILLSIEDAMEQPEEKVKVEQYLLSTIAEPNNAFELLNLAFAHGGLYLRVPRNVVVDQDIHFIYQTSASSAPLMISPQKLVIVEENASVRFTEDFRGSGTYLNNLLNRIFVASGAQAEHIRFQWEGANAFQINNTSISQERDSTYTNFNLDLGSALNRNNVYTTMLASGITTNLYGAFLGNERQHLDSQTFVDHAFPHCQSNELYKGILTDRSRGVFNGKVIVRQDAQKTNAFQQNSNLVLSPTAVMDTKPQLEIFADDVKCSHGATVGQLDESSVFYLRSRGLTDYEARRLLQFGFLLEVLENLKAEYLHDYAANLVEEKFGETA